MASYASAEGRRRRRVLPVACCGAVALFGIGLTVSLLSPTTILNALTLWGNYTLTADIAYAPGRNRGGLDVYAPRASGARKPVVVFFYGGNWETGDKALYRFVGAAPCTAHVLRVDVRTIALARGREGSRQPPVDLAERHVAPHRVERREACVA